MHRDRFILFVCFMVLKSQKVTSSICGLTAYTRVSWLISGQGGCYHSPPSSLGTLKLPGYESWALQLSGWSFCPFMVSARSFLDALCDSPFFAINCDVLLEASIINDEHSHFGLSRVWQAGLFDLESYYQRTENEPHAQTMPGWLPPVPSSVPKSTRHILSPGPDLCIHTHSLASG